MIAVGCAGGYGTFVNMRREFGSGGTALGLVAAGEGATAVLALMLMALTTMGQSYPTPARLGLWLMPLTASITGLWIGADNDTKFVYAVTPLGMSISAEALGFLARRIVVYRTGRDAEAERHNADLTQKIGFHAARSQNHPGKRTRWYSARKVWRLGRYLGRNDPDLAQALRVVQQEQTVEGARAALVKMFAFPVNTLPPGAETPPALIAGNTPAETPGAGNAPVETVAPQPTVNTPQGGNTPAETVTAGDGNSVHGVDGNTGNTVAPTAAVNTETAAPVPTAPLGPETETPSEHPTAPEPGITFTKAPETPRHPEPTWEPWKTPEPDKTAGNGSHRPFERTPLRGEEAPHRSTYTQATPPATVETPAPEPEPTPEPEPLVPVAPTPSGNVVYPAAAPRPRPVVHATVNTETPPAVTAGGDTETPVNTPDETVNTPAETPPAPPVEPTPAPEETATEGDGNTETETPAPEAPDTGNTKEETPETPVPPAKQERLQAAVSFTEAQRLDPDLSLRTYAKDPLGRSPAYLSKAIAEAKREGLITD
ncbi:hypothetical protein DBP12_03155 [Streptomyces sp. CS014]|nr:hypothetical protein DBP12_03155 [Streptomyces sp. CS014]